MTALKMMVHYKKLNSISIDRNNFNLLCQHIKETPGYHTINVNTLWELNRTKIEELPNIVSQWLQF